MKRLGFKPEFQPDILSGRKTATIRANDKKLKVGDRVAAVSAKDGKPDFLIPASERFALLEITEDRPIFWADVADDHLIRTTAPRDWYVKHIPMLTGSTMLHFYGFKVVGS